MANPLAPTFSALRDPADAPYLRLLENCARVRRAMGLPALSQAELEALLDCRERRLVDRYPANVVPLRRERRRPNVER
jgi:hypothetical protein